MIHGFINMTSANRPARDAVIGLAGMIRAQLASAKDERRATGITAGGARSSRSEIGKQRAWQRHLA
jgi:hypothetical protein